MQSLKVGWLDEGAIQAFTAKGASSEYRGEGDLLEDLRQELHDEIGRWLPERRHVALLMRWVNRRQGTPHRRHQAFLKIEDEEAEKLRREQVARDRALP